MSKLYDDYDDYEYKDLRKRIELILSRETIDPISAWDLSNFLSAVSSSYYKIELIDSIASAINNGISPEDIFVLNESFRLNTSYKKLRCLSLMTDDLHQLYKLEGPVSLFPNDNLFALELLFKFFIDVNNLLSRNKCRRLRREMLKDSFSSLKKTGLKDSSTYLIKHAIINLREKKFTDADLKDPKKVEIFNSTVKNLEDLKENTVSQYKNYLELKNNGIFKYVSTCLKENNNIIFNKDQRKKGFDKNKILDKYYSRFFKKMKKLSRPVIGIYNKKKEWVRILCIGNINATQKDYLDIKKVSRESPVTVTLEGLLSIGFIILSGSLSLLFQFILFRKQMKHLKEEFQEDDLKKKEKEFIRKYNKELNVLKKKFRKKFKKLDSKFKQKIEKLEEYEDRLKKYETEIRNEFEALHKKYRGKILMKKHGGKIDEIKKERLEEAQNIYLEYKKKMLALEKIKSNFIKNNLKQIHETESNKAENNVKKNRF